MIDRKLYVRRARVALKVSESLAYFPVLLGWWWSLINDPPRLLISVMFGFLILAAVFAAVSATITLLGWRAEKRHDLATDYADKT